VTAVVASLLAALVEVRHVGTDHDAFIAGLWIDSVEDPWRLAEEAKKTIADVLRAHPEALVALAVEALGPERVRELAGGEK